MIGWLISQTRSHKNKLKHKLNIFFGQMCEEKQDVSMGFFSPYHYHHQGGYDFTHVCLFVS